ncbi:Bug family tripartite tricarboxylate transporter substrate binding protein [Comamonas serinivorans]|nr:tripartite tricarboxylate transporter substrate binding protein [Comamonas serinivorans]
MTPRKPRLNPHAPSRHTLTANPGMTRRHLLGAAAAGTAAGLGLAPQLALAADFPSKPIKLVVPFAPGGATDVLGRLMAKALETPLKQTVIVDNKPGASGAIGATAVVRSPADGYTVLMGGIGTNIVLEHTMPTLSYKPERDFAAVAYLFDVDYSLTVPVDSPYKSLKDLLADAKARPGEVRFMSTGPLGPVHVAMEYLCKLAGVKMIHAPYSGEAPAIPDLLSKRIEVAVMTVPTTRPQVEAGKMRVIASMSAERAPAYPDVPTVAEQGFPGFAMPIWNGLFVPKGTPQAVVDALSNASLQQLKGAELRQSLEKQGVRITAQGAADYERFLAKERVRWKKMIQDSEVLKS